MKSVARLFPTAIISGRGREKVEGFVQLRELYLCWQPWHGHYWPQGTLLITKEQLLYEEI